MLVNKEYQVTAGAEVHCELKSNTKMFSDSNNHYGTFANTNINEIDFAYPGVLPTVNSYAVELALKASLAFHCKINKKMHFDRKNYYYPDLPKGYQITQSHSPIGVNGHLTIPYQEKEFEVLIHDIHLEEDTAQLEHIGDSTYINYNRAGVPLLELVTEPCFHAKEEDSQVK